MPVPSSYSLRVAETDAHRAIRAVLRIESAKLIAGLARMVRDIGLAEDLAQEALVAALSHWPADGIPENPAAWLTATAKRRAIDLLRRDKLLARKHEELAYEAPASVETPEHDVGDDMLRLMFIACHPILAPDARVALTLRLLGGLTTDEIARAYLVPEPTIAQRVVRAKRTLADAGVPFELPEGADRAARIGSVLEAIYLIFNEGYAATAGDDWMRPALCEEAMRLGRVLAALVPKEAEVHGLVALMELQASRIRARTAPDGSSILLLDQDRGRWDHVLIQHGLAALARSERLGGASHSYTLQAAIAACHARAREAAKTDWPRIAGLYDALAAATPSPVIELNRAVAHGMAFGPATGLAIADAVADDPAVAGYYLLPSVRGDLLSKLGRLEEARDEFTRAAAMTKNKRERDVLTKRAQTL